MRRLFIGLAMAAIGRLGHGLLRVRRFRRDHRRHELEAQVVQRLGDVDERAGGRDVDAHFAGDRVSGFGGCNAYGGTAAISGSTIKISDVFSTQMACEGDGSTVETAYLANLANAATFTATADALTIFDSSGKSILVYAAGAANPIEGFWNVTGYNNGNEAVTSPIAGTTLTANFTAGGEVGGSAGCNDYSGTYKLDGTSLTVSQLVTTRKACDQAIMDQETQFLTALQTPTTVETSGATITLRAADGATQVVLAPK